MVKFKEPEISTESLVTLVVGAILGIADMTWWLRIAGVIFTCALIFRLSFRIQCSNSGRGLVAVIASILLVGVTWHPIWDGFHAAYPSAFAAFTDSTPVLCFDRTPSLLDEQQQNDTLFWFRKIRDENPRLGKQTEKCLSTIDKASKLVFEHSYVIWVGNPRAFYVIDPAKLTWSRLPEFDSCIEKWCYDAGPGSEGRKEAEQKFKKGKPPKARFYPDGGIAWYLNTHRGDWNKFGWLEEDCQLKGGKVFELNFENGFMFGIYAQTYDNLVGQIDILYKDDNSVRSAITGNTTGPKCSSGSTVP